MMSGGIPGPGHWRLDPRTGKLDASAVCKRNFGREPGEPFSYEDFLAAVHPEDREAVRSSLRRALEDGDDYEARYRCVWPSGEVRRILARGQPLEPSEGGAPQLAGTTLDVTGDGQAGDEAKSPARLYETILDAAGEGIYGLDAAGRVTFINPAAEEMLGWRAGELLGRRMHEAVHHSRPGGGPYPPQECPLYGTLREGAVHHSDEEVFWRADGTSFPVRYTATPIFEDGVLTGAVVAFSDITRSNRAEEVLRESEERLAADLAGMRRLYELHSRLAAETDLHAALDEIVAAAVEFTGTDRGCVQLVSGDGERLRMAVHRGYGEDSPFVELFRDEGSKVACDLVRAHGERVSVEDVETYPPLAETRDREAALADGIRATQSTPMVSRRGEMVGVLSVQFSEPHRSADHELRLIDLLAWTAADFVERYNAQTALEESEERQAFLLELSDTLQPLADAAEIQGEACRLLAERLDVSRAYYVEVDEAAGTARVERDFVRGGAPSLAGKHRVADFAWSVAILRRGERHVISDTQTSDLVPEADRPASAALGIIATVGAPLIKGGRLAGALCVTDGRPREWSESEVAVLREVGERIWSAVERARAEKALRESEARRHLALDAAEMGTFLYHPQEDRGEPDARMLAIFGLPEDGTLNLAEAVARIIHPDDGERYAEAVGRATDPNGDGVLEEEIRVVHPDESVHWVAVSARVFFEGESPRDARMYGMAADITDRKRREANEAFLNEVSQDLARLTDIDETMNTIGGKIGAHFGLSACLFAELEDAARIGVINHGWHRADMPSLLGTYRMEEFVEDEVLERCRAGKAVVIRDVFADPRTDGEQYAALNIGSFVSIPLVRDGEWRFLLVVYRRERYDWRDDEIELVRELASRIWTRLERARAEEQVREREERLELATEAAELGIWELDLATNASPVRSERHDRIFGYDEPLEEWSFEIFLDHVHPEDRERIRQSFEQALRTGAWEFECRIVRADGEERWIDAEGKFYYEGGERGSEPVRAVGAVQDITERKRAEAEREQARSRAAFLAQASRRLAESLDWGQTLSEVARLAVPRICDLCILDTLSAPEGSPAGSSTVRRLAAAHKDPEKERLAWELERRYPVAENERSAIAEVVRTGDPVLLTEVTEEWMRYMSRDEGQFEILSELGLGSVVIVPLAAHGRTLGALTLASDGSGRRYGEEDLALAQDLARRAAQSMDNARLYEEQSRAARILQRSLLPPSLPEIPGVQAAARYRPASSSGGDASGGYDVGGDFYDLFQTPAGWAVVVGDVMGKGVEAAELTAMARYTLRTAAMTGARPSEVVSTLNTAMLEQRSDHRFCTLVYGLLEEPGTDGGALRLSLCRGGHPPPLILRAGGPVEEAGTRGLLVGVRPEPGLSETPVDLAAGDSVIFYTDGITEARDPRGNIFGAERLKSRVLSCRGLEAREMADEILRGLQEFQDGERARDDVALLVLRAEEG